MKTLVLSLLATFVFLSSGFAGSSFQKASFSGVIGIGGNDPSEQGAVKVSTTATGGYTIVGRVGPKAFSTKGTFDLATGHVEKDIKIKFLGVTVATIHLTLQLAPDGESISGSVQVSGKTYNFTIFRAFYSRTSPTTVAGYFTAQLPSPGGSFPGGTGYAGITVSPAGTVKVVGKLSDGTRLSTGGSLSKGEIFPIFNILYAKRGAIGGFVDFSSNDVATGSLAWVRLAEATPDKLVPDNFSGNVTITIQRYTPPATGTVALPGLDGAGSVAINLTGGNLAPDFAATGNISTANKLTVSGANAEKLKVTIKPKTGFMIGNVKLPLGGVTKAIPFSGMILQTAVNAKAEGYFLGIDKSGVFQVLKN